MPEENLSTLAWCGAVAPDRERFAIGVGSEILLRELAQPTGLDDHRLIGHADVVKSVAFTPNGQTLISRSRESIRLWHVTDRSLRFTLRERFGADENISNIAVSPDGRWIAWGSGSQIRLLRLTESAENAGTGERDVVEPLIATDDRPITSVSFSSTAAPWHVPVVAPTHEATGRWRAARARLRLPFSRQGR